MRTDLTILISWYSGVAGSTYQIIGLCSATYNILTIFSKTLQLTNKVWVKKNVTHIALNFSNLDCFSEKSFKSSKNTHAKDLKMVRQVNIVKKLPPGIMIKYKIHFWENTNFVKKEFAKKVILHLWVSCKLCLL